MNSASLQLRCPAKINLGLKVVGKREDGYHDLLTVFLALNLYDDLVITLNPDLKQPSFTCENESLKFCETNTIYKAYQVLKEKYHIPSGLEIELKKRIPAGGGLGGGSSDAAFFIRGINQLLGMKLTHDEMRNIAVQVGMDVPFFINPVPSLASGRGDVLKPLKVNGFNYIIVLAVNELSISTPEIFGNYNFILTKSDFFINLKALLTAEKREIEAGKLIMTMENDLEKVALKKHPKLKKIKRGFLEGGAVKTLMSGSGATIFGVFEDGNMNFEKLNNLFENEKGIRLIVCQPALNQVDCH